MRDDLVKICNCGCMYKEDECPNCNKVTDKDHIKELKFEVKHLKAEVKYLRLRVMELDRELDPWYG